MALTDKLAAIGNAIRSVTGGTVTLSLSQMAEVIRTLSPSFSVTNLVSTAIDSDGTPYNGGVGYKTNCRISAETGLETTTNAGNFAATGFIAVAEGDIIRAVNVGQANAYPINVWTYNSQFQKLNIPTGGNDTGSGAGGFILGLKIKKNTSYIRFCVGSALADKLIITKNQKISPLEAD